MRIMRIRTFRRSADENLGPRMFGDRWKLARTRTTMCDFFFFGSGCMILFFVWVVVCLFGLFGVVVFFGLFFFFFFFFFFS